MLKQVAEGVLTHQSELLENNAVVVQGPTGVLLIDPGLTDAEMICLADDLRELGQSVVAGFATHPDWDHVLRHPAYGDAPRYGTARCAAHMREVRADPGRRAHVAEGLPPEIAEETPLDLYGLITDTNDPLGEYLVGLRLLEDVAGDVDVMAPGHGSVCGAGGIRARIEQDRAYVLAVRAGRVPSDQRGGPTAEPGWEWTTGISVDQAGASLKELDEASAAARPRTRKRWPRCCRPSRSSYPTDSRPSTGGRHDRRFPTPVSGGCRRAPASSSPRQSPRRTA